MSLFLQKQFSADLLWNHCRLRWNLRGDCMNICVSTPCGQRKWGSCLHWRCDVQNSVLLISKKCFRDPVQGNSRNKLFSWTVAWERTKVLLLIYYSSLSCFSEDTLAPPIKQKARFKIKDAKCHLRPRNKEKHRDSSKQNLQGKRLVTWANSLSHLTI